VINPGSLGLSHDPGGYDLMSYAMLDTSAGEGTLVRRAKPVMRWPRT
jgi:hypothetical protein